MPYDTQSLSWLVSEFNCKLQTTKFRVYYIKCRNAGLKACPHPIFVADPKSKGGRGHHWTLGRYRLPHPCMTKVRDPKHPLLSVESYCPLLSEGGSGQPRTG